jgi:hypothetical protein
MFDHLVKLALTLSEERLAALSLEDMTLCALWCDSYRDNNERRAEFDALRAVLDVWANCAAPPEEPSEGYRQQPLLRELIELVSQGGIPHMTRDETDFLVFAWGLAQRAKNPELRERPMARLVPVIHLLEERRERLEPAPGLPSLSKRIAVVTAEMLQHAEAHDLRTFGGLDVPVRGPVFVHRGNLKVVDGIPDGCAVLVEEGHCTVSGMVLGKLCAMYNCEILDNVSGVVVSQRGDIRLRNAINQATIVAKEGSVRCTGAHEPRIIFGCTEVVVRQFATHGRYIGANITVHEEATAAEMHVSAMFDAGRCRNTPSRSTAIVLRTSLSCNDYGEVLSADSTRLLSASMKLRQRMLMLASFQEMNEREADDYAGNVLLYLLGEDKTTDQVEKVQRLRSKNAYLERMENTLRSLIMAIEDRLSLGGEEHDLDSPFPPFGPEERAIAEEMQQDLMALAAEGPIERALFEEREEILSLVWQMFRKLLTRKKILDTLQKMLARASDIAEMRQKILELIEQREAILEKSMSRLTILERAKQECARVEVMQQLIAASRGREDMATFRDRCANRYVKLMLRNIETRRSRVTDYRTAIGGLQDKLRKNRSKLWTEYQMSLPEHLIEGVSNASPMAVACFDPGVQLLAWKHLLESGFRNDAGRLTTSSESEERTAFRRTRKGTVVPCPVPDPAPAPETTGTAAGH